MNKKKILIIGLVWFGILFGGIAVGVVLNQLISPNKQSDMSEGYVDESMEKVTQVNGKPVQDVTYPDGTKIKAMAGELIVRISSPETVKSLGSKLKPLGGVPNTYIYTVEPGKDLLKSAEELKNKQGVESAEPNYVNTSMALPRVTPNDPDFGKQFHLNEISAPEAWSITTAGAPIAIIDTGANRSNPEISPKVAINTADPVNGIDDDGNGYADDNYGMDFVNATINGSTPVNDANGADDFLGHGTYVSQTAAGFTNNSRAGAGVSWGAPIIPIKVLDDTPPSGAGNEGTAIQGIYYAIARGARVINLSMGHVCPSTADCSTEVMRMAIAAARSRGIVIVAASGNNGTGIINSPASHPGVIAVGGSAHGSLSRHPSSQYGPQLALVAPYIVFGETTPNGSRYYQGTSFSTPQVAAVASMMLAIKPNLSPDQVKLILIASANGGDNQEVGGGRLNAYRALEYTRRCP